MHGDNGSRAMGDVLLYLGDVYVVRGWIYIYEHRPCTIVFNSLRGRDEGVGRCEDFITLAQTKGFQGQKQSVRSTTYAYSVTRTAEPGELMLEAGDLIS